MHSAVLLIDITQQQYIDRLHCEFRKEYINFCRQHNVTPNIVFSSEREDWIQGIENTVSKIEGDIILVGHSCGAVAITQWALTYDTRKVKGALLVAPADVDSDSAIPPIHVQRPLPKRILPFATKLIYSDNDEHSTLTRSEKMGKDWGSELIMVQGASHFHTEAGFGEWPDAEKWISQLSESSLQHR